MEISNVQLGCNELSCYQKNLNEMKKGTSSSDRELVLLEEEIESLRSKRPPSLRMNAASGKKERDPQYHCLMEQVRRRTMKYSVSRLRATLAKGPQRHSLQTVLEGALKEVALLKKKENTQNEQLSSLAEKRENLKKRLRELGSEDKSNFTSPRSSPEPMAVNNTASPLSVICTYSPESSPSPLSSAGSVQSLSSISSGSTVTQVPLTMPFYPPVVLRTNTVQQQQFPKLVMYPFLSGMPVVSPPFNSMSTFCRVVPQNHFFPTMLSAVRQAN